MDTERAKTIERGQGCLLGQLAGDALGGMVEFLTPEQIEQREPGGSSLHHLQDGGIWDTLAGQPTDDSEMALLLARLLAQDGRYNQPEALRAYQFWLESGPFDCGSTIRAALTGQPNPKSEANGALMRISPLGILGAGLLSDSRNPARTLARIGQWAEDDASLTHPNPVCQQANILYTKAIAHAIHYGTEPLELYRLVVTWAERLMVEPRLMEAITLAAKSPPDDYVRNQGWVLIALRNALWRLLNAPSLEEAVVETVRRGGDTDTNAAICGALVGAVHGRSAVPQQWIDSLSNCRPEEGAPGVHTPRPPVFWPVDALELASRLLEHRERGPGRPPRGLGFEGITDTGA